MLESMSSITLEITGEVSVRGDQGLIPVRLAAGMGV